MTDQELAQLLISRMHKITVTRRYAITIWKVGNVDFIHRNLASTIDSDETTVELIALPTIEENTELINIWYQVQCLEPFGLTHPRADYLAQYIV